MSSAPNATTAEPDVTLGIITWNAKALMRQLLDSIREQVHGVAYEIVVVDNDSHDGTKEMIKAEYPEVRLFENERNVGVGPARNRLLRESRGRYVLSLDNDTTMLANDAVGILVRTMDAHPNAAVSGPKLVYKDGSLQLSCRPFPRPLNILLEGTGLRRWFGTTRWVLDYTLERWDHATLREIDWMYGAALMIRRSALPKLGLFDEGFFYLYEDVEFCLRAKRLGYQILYIPDAVICHHLEREGRSVLSKTLQVHVRSILRYLRRLYFGYPDGFPGVARVAA